MASTSMSSGRWMKASVCATIGGTYQPVPIASVTGAVLVLLAVRVRALLHERTFCSLFRCCSSWRHQLTGHIWLMISLRTIMTF